MDLLHFYEIYLSACGSGGEIGPECPATCDTCVAACNGVQDPPQCNQHDASVTRGLIPASCPAMCGTCKVSNTSNAGQIDGEDEWNAPDRIGLIVVSGFLGLAACLAICKCKAWSGNIRIEQGLEVDAANAPPTPAPTP